LLFKLINTFNCFIFVNLSEYVAGFLKISMPSECSQHETNIFRFQFPILCLIETPIFNCR